jgi:hypothetical protein
MAPDKTKSTPTFTMLNRLKQETGLVADQFRESGDGGFEVG